MVSSKSNPYAGRPGLVFVKDGRVRSVISPAQLRVLLAVETHGAAVPVRTVTRIIWREQAGALSGSQRASAARSVTRLLERDLLEQPRTGAALALTERGRGILAAHRPLIAEIVGISADA